jgi:hypothetical protein
MALLSFARDGETAGAPILEDAGQVTVNVHEQ